MSKACAIVGIHETDLIATGRSALDLNVEAALGALQDAGLGCEDVDGLATAGLSSKFGTSALAEALGIQPRWFDASNHGGASFEIFVRNAAAAINGGIADTVLITYGSVQRSARKRGLSSAASEDLPINRHEEPYGPLLPITAYALAATRYMYESRASRAELAEIAVAAREWALLNPGAYRHSAGSLTVEQVLASDPVSSPLHVLDCCLVTDGGAAVVVTSLERARALRHEPVVVLGSGATSSHRSLAQNPDLTLTGARRSSEEAFRKAGLGPSDMDVVEIYDSFTITVALTLEALGFCDRGEGAAFAADGRLRPGGSFPINTNGGGLSHCHPGMYGLFLLTEAVTQLRGGAGERQLPSSETAVCHGTGGYLNTHATVILGQDR